VIHYCLLVLFQSRDTPTQRIIENESSSRRPRSNCFLGAGRMLNGWAAGSPGSVMFGHLICIVRFAGSRQQNVKWAAHRGVEQLGSSLGS
jgi:hypothetical protein